jgi:uncharacterized protein
MLRREVLAFGAASLMAASARAETSKQREATWPPAMTMGTASPGGTYGVYGALWGWVVGQATGVELVYRATQGPNENILLLDREAIDLGMTTLGVAHEAWVGAGGWTHGTRLREMRALFPMYDTPFHGFAPARSRLTGMAQLAGRRVGVGPQGGTGGSYVPAMFQLLGIESVTFAYGTIKDQAAQLLAGELDACVLAVGAPVPAFEVALKRAPMMLLGFTDAEIARLRQGFPELSASLLSREAYPGQARPLQTVGMFNFALCRPGLPADLVYLAVKSVIESPAALRPMGRLAQETSLANVERDGFLPFHPGAARYYREKGVLLPDTLVMG